MGTFYQLGLFSLLVNVLKKVVSEPKNILLKTIEAVYGLLLAITSNIEFSQLKEMENMDEMETCVTYAMEILEMKVGGAEEVVLEFLAGVAEYTTRLRGVVQDKEMKARGIERVLL